MQTCEPISLSQWHERFRAAEEALNGVVLGQRTVIRLLLLCVLSRGHVLLQGDVGTGKTTLLRALSRVIGGPYARIEGTVDLLPSDLIYDAHLDEDGRPRVEPGPLLSAGENLSVFFFNEINRARPQVHALLLRLMAERTVTAFRREHRFPHLQVFADRNQIERDETFELPAAARDRFMMEIAVEAPTNRADRIALAFETRFHDTDRLIERLDDGLLPYKGLNALATEVQTGVQASPALQRYVHDLCDGLRDPASLGITLDGVEIPRLMRGGASPRGMQALVRVARTAAWAEGRDMVLPADIRAVFPAVMAHRTFLAPSYEPRRDRLIPALFAGLFDRVAVPAE